MHPHAKEGLCIAPCVLVRQGLGRFLSPSCPDTAEPFPCGMSFCPPALLGCQEFPQGWQTVVVKSTLGLSGA